MNAAEKGKLFYHLNNPALGWIVLAMCLATIIAVAVKVPYLGAGNIIIDFDALYITGQMIHDGRLIEAYDAATMRAIQSALSGENTFMPWTYPPPFDLVVAPLPLLPRGLSYLLFTGATFAAYILILRRLAGNGLTAVLIATFPALYFQTLIGQNGFLTGALIGLFCLLSLRGRATAGIPLGLMIIKPHLGLGLGLMLLAQRRWKVILVAAACAALACALSTLAFGTEVWSAFFSSAHEAGVNLYDKRYRLFRMTSVYAFFASVGMASALSMKLHLGAALLASAAIVWVALQGWTAARVLGCSVLLSLAISPYTYDYDLTILGIGLALLMPDLMRHASRAEMSGVVLTAWLATGWGPLLTFAWLPMSGDGALDHNPDNPYWSLAAIGYLSLLGIIATVLRRAVRDDERAESRSDGAVA